MISLSVKCWCDERRPGEWVGLLWEVRMDCQTSLWWPRGWKLWAPLGWWEMPAWRMSVTRFSGLTASCSAGRFRLGKTCRPDRLAPLTYVQSPWGLSQGDGLMTKLKNGVPQATHEQVFRDSVHRRAAPRKFPPSRPISSLVPARPVPRDPAHQLACRKRRELRS